MNPPVLPPRACTKAELPGKVDPPHDGRGRWTRATGATRRGRCRAPYRSEAARRRRSKIPHRDGAEATVLLPPEEALGNCASAATSVASKAGHLILHNPTDSQRWSVKGLGPTLPRHQSGPTPAAEVLPVLGWGSLSPYSPTPGWASAARIHQAAALLLGALRLQLVPDLPLLNHPRHWVCHGCC